MPRVSVSCSTLPGSSAAPAPLCRGQLHLDHPAAQAPLRHERRPRRCARASRRRLPHTRRKVPQGCERAPHQIGVVSRAGVGSPGPRDRSTARHVHREQRASGSASACRAEEEGEEPKEGDCGRGFTSPSSYSRRLVVLLVCSAVRNCDTPCSNTNLRLPLSFVSGDCTHTYQMLLAAIGQKSSFVFNSIITVYNLLTVVTKTLLLWSIPGPTRHNGPIGYRQLRFPPSSTT